MTVKELMHFLEYVKPETELGISLGYRQDDLKSFDVFNEKLYFTNGNWAPSAEQMKAMNIMSIITSVAHFTAPSDYDRGFQDGLKANKEKHGE